MLILGLDARNLQLDLEGEGRPLSNNDRLDMACQMWGPGLPRRGGRSVAYADANLVMEEGQASHDEFLTDVQVCSCFGLWPFHSAKNCFCFKSPKQLLEGSIH